jgi:anti-sigma factor RsiW
MSPAPNVSAAHGAPTPSPRHKPMITCVEQLISEYVDGDLSPAVARDLEDHLRICAECRVLLLDYCGLVAAAHLLAARRHRPGDYARRAAEIRHRNGFGQARTSGLLA